MERSEKYIASAEHLKNNEDINISWSSEVIRQCVKFGMKQYQSSKNINIKRHYETKHSQDYSKFTGRLRLEEYESY